MIDTFSGIGGFSLAARWLGGFETVQFVEREPYCRHILRKHWPDVPIHNDIYTFKPAAGSADIVCGGFPCQDISTAGKQAGIKEGTRSGLFYELMRVVRLVGPRYVVLENVAAITSNGIDIVLGQMAEAGFDAEWACIPASDVGACHRRDRWWLVGTRWDARERGSRNIAGNAGDAATNPDSVRCQRQGKAGDVVGQTGAGEVNRQQRQRDGDAADDCGAVIACAMLQQCERSWPQGECEPNPQREKWQPMRSHQGLALSPDWRTYASEPVLRRGNDGLSSRVDRLRALGNAVVPQVAMIPLARVLELETYRRHC
jgi:DNA (cytosine-5)-methyltransferase 1